MFLSKIIPSAVKDEIEVWANLTGAIAGTITLGAFLVGAMYLGHAVIWYKIVPEIQQQAEPITDYFDEVVTEYHPDKTKSLLSARMDLAKNLAAQDQHTIIIGQYAEKSFDTSEERAFLGALIEQEQQLNIRIDSLSRLIQQP